MIMDPAVPFMELIRLLSGPIALALMVAGLLVGGIVYLLNRDRELALFRLAALMVGGVICWQLQSLVAYLFPLAS